MGVNSIFHQCNTADGEIGLFTYSGLAVQPVDWHQDHLGQEQNLHLLMTAGPIAEVHFLEPLSRSRFEELAVMRGRALMHILCLTVMHTTHNLVKIKCASFQLNAQMN